MSFSIERQFKLLIALMLAFCTSVNAGNPSISNDDRAEIRDLLSKYAHAWDSKNVEKFISLFTEEAIVQIYLAGVLKGEAVTVEQRTQHALMRTRKFRAEGIQTRHYLTNTLLTLQPDNAIRGKTYFYVTWQYEGEMSPIPKHTGVYMDTFVKTDSGWKFLKHETRVDHK
jgi:3-phenylpropionate/cinnamic acid dioxygenase small subunit